MSQESLVTFGDQGDIFKIDTGEAGGYFNAKPTNDGELLFWENDSSGFSLSKFYPDVTEQAAKVSIRAISILMCQRYANYQMAVLL